jgi:hypothetical protein
MALKAIKKPDEPAHNDIEAEYENEILVKADNPPPFISPL